MIYRGKLKNNGEWIYGNLLMWEELTFISKKPALQRHEKDDSYSFGGFYEVIPETISRFTGLRGQHKKKIYENDIVIWRDMSGKIYHAIVEFGRYGNMDYGFYLKWIEDMEMRPNFYFWVYWDEYDYRNCISVVGNVFDNPELLEVKNGNQQ